MEDTGTVTFIYRYEKKQIHSNRKFYIFGKLEKNNRSLSSHFIGVNSNVTQIYLDLSFLFLSKIKEKTAFLMHLWQKIKFWMKSFSNWISELNIVYQTKSNRNVIKSTNKMVLFVLMLLLMRMRNIDKYFETGKSIERILSIVIWAFSFVEIKHTNEKTSFCIRNGNGKSRAPKNQFFFFLLFCCCFFATPASH